MSKLEELHALANDAEKLKPPTEREVVKILLLSYEFSQGNIPLQKNILERIATYFEQPIVLDEETVIKSLTDQILDPRSNQLRLAQANAHREVIKGRLDEEIEENIPTYYQTLTTAPRPIDLLRNKALLEKIWKRDSDVMQRIGRPNRNDEGSKDTLQDPFYSIGVKYFIKMKNTNSDIFNRFLQELRATDIEDLNKKTLLAMQRVLELYIETHPEESDTMRDYLNKVSALIEV